MSEVKEKSLVATLYATKLSVAGVSSKLVGADRHARDVEGCGGAWRGVGEGWRVASPSDDTCC